MLLQTEQKQGLPIFKGIFCSRTQFWIRAQSCATLPPTGRKETSMLTNCLPAYLQPLLQGLNTILLARQVGPGIAALAGKVEHLAVALFPHLVVGVDGQVTVAHTLLHHLHLLSQKLRGLQKGHKKNERKREKKKKTFSLQVLLVL